MDKISFLAIRAQQSPNHTVVSFAASAEDLLRFASIERIGRDSEGHLSGFQRPQIASHIREIRDYLEKAEAVLPNPIVVAFTDGITIEPLDGNVCRILIETSDIPPGLVVDGQQRLSALSQIENKDFQVFVSALICKDDAELRRQFVLINNTKPLPKSLIYELLPTVDGLPHRLDARTFAADLTARLNYDPNSSLKGLIRQQTNPNGFIADTSIQRVVMNSVNDGMMREFIKENDGAERCFDLISEFYRAVQKVFANEWNGHTPKTSRLVHGAGIVSLGYVMEILALLDGARNWEDFAKGMGCLSGRTAWTHGEWKLAENDIRHWKAIQNINKDIVSLTHYLTSIVRSDLRSRRTDVITS
ncbi:DGQHR domain-containing protein [Methylomonas sp. LW13]|uniref:DGQHR domain-containing protein DpdB n=1 Tax=unclassified Methylomonas TaxID=2608980 RepID=UPI00051BEAC8|nr:DGQHR domain-containing protein DpdB [Methylomonas sp. LW13]QBC28124.1 DGQHR domain-containing protein [Methylomonas sp. LW13]